jgi:teichuronic acid biosynthesis glycosyltransferase TuaH
MSTNNSDIAVVFFTLFRTDNPYSSISLSMAQELEKTHKVLYVNHPYSLRDVLKGLQQGDVFLKNRLWRILTGRNSYERLPGFSERFLAVQPPVTLPINWLPKGALYRFFQKINNGIVLRAIRRGIRRHGIGQYVYINCYDPFFAGVLPPEMGAQTCIYHCIDDISQDPYTAKHGFELEMEAIQKADLTFVTSSNLYTLKAPFARRIVAYYNAADTRVFSRVITEKYPRPKELEGRKGKVIGFTGNLDALRIDYILLKKVAEAYPDCTLLLVGPVNSPEAAALGLDKMPNVVLAGSRKLADLPPLMQYMDCVLIPFLCNTLTRSIYPLKINEYLAAGKPVVSSSFSEDIRTFGHCIYLAESHEDFLEQIAVALAETDPALLRRRTEVAESNSWQARIRELWFIINGVKHDTPPDNC